MPAPKVSLQNIALLRDSQCYSLHLLVLFNAEANQWIYIHAAGSGVNIFIHVM